MSYAGRCAAGPVAPNPLMAAYTRRAIERGQAIRGKAQPRQRAGAKILDQHVRAPDQPGQRGAARVLLQVEHHRPLAAVQAGEVGGLAAPATLLARQKRPEPARFVALRRFHLDHLGAKVAQHHGAVGAGEDAGQVDHGNAAQRWRGSHERHPTAIRAAPSTAASAAPAVFRAAAPIHWYSIGPDVAPDVVAAARPHLVGADPFATEHLADRLRYYAAGTSYRGRAGIDVALWWADPRRCARSPPWPRPSGRRVVPHHGGSALGIIAHLHLVASWPHAPYLELLHDPPVGDYRHLFAALADPPRVGGDGCMAVPTAPGLGVDIDPEARKP